MLSQRILEKIFFTIPQFQMSRMKKKIIKSPKSYAMISKPILEVKNFILISQQSPIY